MTETTINFLEFIRQFEASVQTVFEFELLEMNYAPYSFGSGMIVYRIKGRVVKVIYDCKSFLATLFVSAKHIKYPGSDWTEVFSGSSSDLLTSGIRDLKNHLL